MAQRPSVTLIVAATMNNGIGSSGRLPWRLPREMAYFTKVTTTVPETASSENDGASQAETISGKNAVIMGRSTWESIPLAFRPLKGRINIILSRNDLKLDSPDTVKVSTIDEALSFRLTPGSEALSTSSNSSIHHRFLIGGAQIYCYALSQHLVQPSYSIDRILMTRIYHPEFPQCDVFMPEFRSPEQIAEEAKKPGQSQVGSENLDGAIYENRANWRKCTSSELRAWAGFEVPEGTQEENGVSYEFQMWERMGSGSERLHPAAPTTAS